MRKLILIISILNSLLFLGQNISSIRKEVEKINTVKNYTIKTIPYSYFLDKDIVTDNGIELKGYYKNGKLNKIDYFVGLSVWNVITQYYFSKDEKLIFVLSKRYLSKDEDGFLKKPKLVSESKYYYANNRLIKTIIDPNEMDNENDFSAQSKLLIEDLKKYK